MAPDAHFPLLLPLDARRPFATTDVAQRVAEVAELEPDMRLLELGGGAGCVGLVLARELGLQVVLGALDDAAVSRLRELAREEGVVDRVDVRRVELEKLPFRDGEFHAVVVQGHVPLSFEQATRRLRRFLVPHEGRLVLTYPVRVGRHAGGEAQGFWQQRLGESLRLPRELLEAFNRAGFESEDCLTLDDRQLDEVYRSLEEALGEEPTGAAEALRQEVALHRAEDGRSRVSYSLLVGRRRETGERPFTSRDRG